MDIKNIKNNPYGTITSQNDLINRSNKIAKGKTASISRDSSSQGDTVNLSSDGKLRIEGYRIAMQSQDIREEKVASIKASIEAGTYEIDSKDIARKILDSEVEIFG